MLQFNSHQGIFRQINTLILFLTALCNSMIVQSLSAINNQIVQYLPGVTSTQISACALVFMMIHPCATLPVNYILDKFSLKIAVSIDCIMVMIGICLRILVIQGFAWVLVGNIIVAIGNAFILYCPAKYSALWYPPKNRLLVTGLIIFANNVSGGVGAFLSPFFVKPQMNKEDGQNAIKSLMIFQAILIGSIMILNLLFFKGQPVKTNEEENIEERFSLKQSYIVTLKQLFKNKQFLLTFFSIFFFLSALNSLLTNVQLLITPFGLGSKEAGLSALLVLPAALTGSILTSLIVKKTRFYKKIIMIETIIAIFSLIITFGGLFIKMNIFFWIGIILIGLFGFPIIPTVIQYGCESLFPVGQATISGLLIGGGQLMSFVLGLLQSEILSNKKQISVLYVIIIDLICFLITFILIKLSTQKLRRMQTQQKNILGGSLFSQSRQSSQSIDN